MKTAIYVQDGRAQVVLTPESEWEKRVLADFTAGRELTIARGSFYECLGGWIRHGVNDDTSVMLTIKKESSDRPDKEPE